MKKAIILLCTLLILAITGCSNIQSNTTSANQNNDNSNPPAADAANMPLAASETVSPSSVSKNPSVEDSQKDNNTIPSINGIASDYNIVRTGFDQTQI